MRIEPEFIRRGLRARGVEGDALEPMVRQVLGHAEAIVRAKHHSDAEHDRRVLQHTKHAIKVLAHGHAVMKREVTR